MKVSRPALVLAAAILLGCGEPSRLPDDAGPADASDASDAAPDAYVDPAAVLDALLATCDVRLEACRGTAACGCDFGDYCLSVDRGCRNAAMWLAGSSPVRVTIDFDALAACQERVREAGQACRYGYEVLNGCAIAAYTVLVGEGEDCVADGASCMDGEGRCRGGSCNRVAIVGEGDFCDGPYARCGEGLVCNAVYECVRPRARGEACSRVSACEEGLVCVGGTCGDVRDAGAPCVLPDDCGDGLTCVDDVCVAPTSSACTTSRDCGRGEACFGSDTRICVADVPDGGRCARDADCAVTSFCSSVGECTDKPGLGELCEGPCEEGSVCDAATLRCITGAPAEIGEPCYIWWRQDPPVDCVPGAWCDDETETCLARVGEGEPCTRTAGCHDDLWCDWDVCAPRPDVGEMCTAVCRDGARCVGGRCEAGTLGAEGELCDTNEHCEPTLRCIDSDTCRPPLADGEECNNPTCAAGSGCRSRADEGAGVCRGDICTRATVPIF